MRSEMRSRSGGRDEAESRFSEVAIEREGLVETALAHHLETHRIDQTQVAPIGANHRGCGPLVHVSSDSVAFACDRISRPGVSEPP